VTNLLYYNGFSRECKGFWPFAAHWFPGAAGHGYTGVKEDRMKISLSDRGHDVYLDAYFPRNAGHAGHSGLGGRTGVLLPAVLICPGGGYRVVGTTEGRPVADKFNEAGYAAFILNYTVGERASFGAGGFKDFAPMLDLKAAMCLLHERADEYGIDAGRIVLAGFSAGGHLAAAYCLSPDGATAADGAGSSSLPAALLLTYAMGGGADSGGVGKPQPAYDVARMPYATDPAVRALPVFLWHGKDDQMVPYEVSKRLDQRLTSEHMEHKFLLLEHGVHARPFADPSWFPVALNWLKNHEKP
jgi:acetyl esterase/lipase